MPELPEVETVRRQLAPICEGRRLRRVAMLDPRWCAPLAPAGARRRGPRAADRALSPPRQVPDLGSGRGRPPDPAPADDRDDPLPIRPEQRHVRVTIELSRRAGMPASAGVRRPATLRHRAAAARRARRSRTSSPARLGLEPIDPRFTTAHLARGPARPPNPRSRRCCSTSDGSRASATSMPMRRCTARASIRGGRPGRSAARRSSGCARALAAVLEAGDRFTRREHRRLPRRRRRLRQLPGPLSRPPARRRALRRPAARDRQDRPSRAGEPTSASAASRARARRR